MSCASLVVRAGENAPIPRAFDPESKTHKHVHTTMNVHREMLYQIARDFSGIGDVMSMPFSEIRFWYDALRPELREATKPKK